MSTLEVWKYRLYQLAQLKHIIFYTAGIQKQKVSTNNMVHLHFTEIFAVASNKCILADGIFTQNIYFFQHFQIFTSETEVSPVIVTQCIRESMVFSS